MSGTAAPPPGLLSAQQDTYQACLGKGLWLVWGPPGTGKTRVLQAAISDLMATGKRVLLVSATNIAVDNALLGVIRERRHQQGDVVRVGSPQMSEIINDPEVNVRLMVQNRLAEVEQRRYAAASDLLEMNRRRDRLQGLDDRLSGFDPDEYQQASALLASPGKSAAETSRGLDRCQAQADSGLRAIEEARAALRVVAETAAEADPVRPRWAEIQAMEAELSDAEIAAQRANARALAAQEACASTQDEIAALHQPNGKVRWRDRGAVKDARNRLAGQLPGYELLAQAAADARLTASAFRENIETAIADVQAASGLTREEIVWRDAAADDAGTRVSDLEQAQLSTLRELEELRQAHAEALEAEETVADCLRRGWPETHVEASALREEVTRDDDRRPAVEERHAELQKQYEKLARDAQGEIIRAARLVATTLAKFRTVKAVLDGPYDVVLIDEVGAAALPEVLLAVAKAAECAVLLGDFMQLGPVIDKKLENSDRPDIQRWILTDPFRHCGISTAAEAQNHPGCLVLDTQHRFGPQVMRLANRLAYDDLLKAGDSIRAHDESDPEIVLIDTDGLNDLASVRKTSAMAGWWPAGLLLSRALVELHHEYSETTGVVTPYGVQADTTLEALRDVEPDGRPLAEVGTAHRFQGREFPVVVFDTVESAYEKPMWMGQASRLPGSNSWKQSGVRLFNVATTRVRHRLYVIASRERVLAAGPGTALGHLGALVRDRQQVRSVQAASLITPLESAPVDLGPESTRLAEILSRHAEISEVHDERSYYEQFDALVSEARHTVWIWSAWVASRINSILPLLKAAVDRGVQVTVFVRDPSDRLQRRADMVAALSALRAVVPRVVEMNVMHEKVVVIDDRIVMMGSLNTLSQHHSREVMITMRGYHWARRLLAELHAEEFSRPPQCGACGGQEIDLSLQRLLALALLQQRLPG